MKFYNEYIYYIVKDEHSKKLSLKQEQVILEKEPSLSDLQKFYNFSAFLGEAYCSCLPMCPEKKERKDFDYIEIEFREKALAYEQTLSKIIKKNNVIAYSHRYGGFKGFSWKFNDEISFVINTNFGYGSVSYFFMLIYYNNLKLAPYSHLIKFRFADARLIMSYTYDYSLDYSYWSKLMQDALEFYNAVVDLKEHKIFQWITGHLSNLVNGLERFINSSEFYFDNMNEPVKGDDFWEVKTFKIAEALKFIGKHKVSASAGRS